MRYLFEDCVVDTDLRELRRGDAAVSLEPLAFDVLAYLIRNRDRVVSKDELRETIWAGRVVSESTLSSWMTTIRGAVGDNGEAQRLIRTVPRRGFRFVGSVSEGPMPPDGTNGEHPVKELPTAPRDQHNHFASTENSGSASGADSRGVVAPSRTVLWLAAIAGLGAVAAAVILLWPGLIPFRGGSTAQPVQKFEFATVPLVDNETRRSLATYRDRPDFKALAIANTGVAIGVADGASDVERAKSDALQQCTANAKGACRIYAVGMDVTWSKESLSMPALRDLRKEPLDIPLVASEIPTLSDFTRNHVAERYVKPPGHKALALTTGQVWLLTRMSSTEEVSRMVVERCSFGNVRPCLLLSVNGFLTIQIPKSRRVTAIFLPSTELEISAPDRDRIAGVYQGREWRALARGANGSWHPIADAPSEAAAIDAALKSCAQADRDCRLYAVGNFRVAE